MPHRICAGVAGSSAQSMRIVLVCKAGPAPERGSVAQLCCEQLESFGRTPMTTNCDRLSSHFIAVETDAQPRKVDQCRIVTLEPQPLSIPCRPNSASQMWTKRPASKLRSPLLCSRSPSGCGPTWFRVSNTKCLFFLFAPFIRCF